VACWCGILAVFLPYSAAILNAAHNKHVDTKIEMWPLDPTVETWPRLISHFFAANRQCSAKLAYEGFFLGSVRFAANRQFSCLFEKKKLISPSRNVLLIYSLLNKPLLKVCILKALPIKQTRHLSWGFWKAVPAGSTSVPNFLSHLVLVLSQSKIRCLPLGEGDKKEELGPWRFC
jgi:hypothetical protein